MKYGVKTVEISWVCNCCGIRQYKDVAVVTGFDLKRSKFHVKCGSCGYAELRKVDQIRDLVVK
jgi:predicted nucleic-acid-binding Zn-ribbon protein